MKRGLPVLAACAIGAALCAPAASAAGRETVLLTADTPGQAAGFAGLDRAHDRVFVSTLAALTPDDTDSNVDLYERSGGGYTLISGSEPGASARSGGGQFRAMSADGERIFFTTTEPLVEEDTDPWDDLYERSGGHTRLLSAGTDFFGFPLFWRGASDDGSRLFFSTTESLLPDDTDGADDVYGWFDDALHLMSVDAAGDNFSAVAEYDGISSDGMRVFFATTAAAAPGDGDTGRDVYERSGDATALVTTDGASDVSFKNVSADGEHVFFETSERIDPADTDDEKDLYEAGGGQTLLVSTGPAGGNGPYRSDFQRAARDGTRVYFTTSDRLVSTDTDDSDDIYQRHAGVTTLESVGPAGGNGGQDLIVEGVNAAGTRMYFRTLEQLTVDDTDFATDSYVREGGQTARVTIGAINDDDSGTDAGFAGATESGDRIFFTSLQRMTADDDDTSERDDIYERAGGVTTLVSTGPEIAANTTRYDAVWEAFSADGRRVWFSTYERLTADDQDDALDVYESRALPDPPPPPAGEPAKPPEETPGSPSGNEQITTPPPNPLHLSTTLGSHITEHAGTVTIPCRATDGRLRSCAATIALTGDRGAGAAADGAARGDRGAGAAADGAARGDRGAGAAGGRSAGAVVIGRGSSTFGGRGRRAGFVRVRLSRPGIARIRRAGGARGVTVRLRARSVRGRTGALRRGTTLVLPRVYVVTGYATRQFRLPRSERASLAALARDLAGARSVRCVGHSDGSASARFGLRLGLLRAVAVCNALATHGVDARLAPVSAGAGRPRATNATRAGRARNRRVAVVVLR